MNPIPQTARAIRISIIEKPAMVPALGSAFIFDLLKLRVRGFKEPRVRG
jgi:hypothetical protein